MVVATWILAGATALLALTSLVAVVTWRENRRREREDQVASRILESARREFAPKEELGGLKENLTGAAVLGVIILVLALLAKIGTKSSDG